MVEEKAGETEGNRLKCSFGVCTHAHTHIQHTFLQLLLHMIMVIGTPCNKSNHV